MPTKLERHSSSVGPITFTASASTSPRIPFGASAGAIICVTAVTGGAATVAWYVAAGPEATPLPLVYDGASVATTIAAGSAYALSDAVYAAPFLIGVTDTGTATVQIFVKG